MTEDCVNCGDPIAPAEGVYLCEPCEVAGDEMQSENDRFWADVEAGKPDALADLAAFRAEYEREQAGAAAAAVERLAFLRTLGADGYAMYEERPF